MPAMSGGHGGPLELASDDCRKYYVVNALRIGGFLKKKAASLRKRLTHSFTYEQKLITAEGHFRLRIKEYRFVKVRKQVDLLSHLQFDIRS